MHLNVGVVEYSDLERVTIADIPGLVDGASENRGIYIYIYIHIYIYIYIYMSIYVYIYINLCVHINMFVNMSIICLEIRLRYSWPSCESLRKQR
jgi:hypothetical protein